MLPDTRGSAGPRPAAAPAVAATPTSLSKVPLSPRLGGGALPPATALQAGCKVLYHFNRHTAMRPARYLLAENEIVGPTTVIPGLVPAAVSLTRLVTRGSSAAGAGSGASASRAGL